MPVAISKCSEWMYLHCGLCAHLRNKTARALTLERSIDKCQLVENTISQYILEKICRVFFVGLVLFGFVGFFCLVGFLLLGFWFFFSSVNIFTAYLSKYDCYWVLKQHTITNNLFC